EGPHGVRPFLPAGEGGVGSPEPTSSPVLPCEGREWRRTGPVSWLEAAALAFPGHPQWHRGAGHTGPRGAGPLTVAGPRRSRTGLPGGPVRMECSLKATGAGVALQQAGESPLSLGQGGPRPVLPPGEGRSPSAPAVV